MTYRSLILEKKDGIAIITLNQPETRNAMSYTMAEDFERALTEIEADDTLRVFILTGRGESFCSGGDFNTVIKELERPPVEYKPFILRFYRHFLHIMDLPIPTIAAINGHAVGGGFCLALACDMRIASKGAIFGMTFVRLGLHPGMGATFLLPRVVGIARAFEIFMTGELFSAQEAYEMGLLNRVVEEGDLMDEARSLARKIASLPPVPIRFMKRSIYMGTKCDLMEVLEFESFAQAICAETEDLKEGIAAFREKRSPLFKGR